MWNGEKKHGKCKEFIKRFRGKRICQSRFSLTDFYAGRKEAEGKAQKMNTAC
jgi:hypothetical protein